MVLTRARPRWPPRIGATLYAVEVGPGVRIFPGVVTAYACEHPDRCTVTLTQPSGVTATVPWLACFGTGAAALVEADRLLNPPPPSA